MGDLDLSAAVDAGARAWFDRQQTGRMDAGRFDDDGRRWGWDDLAPLDQHAFRALALEIIAPAAQAIRDSIADVIEAERTARADEVPPGHYAGMSHAARIARGDS